AAHNELQETSDLDVYRRRWVTVVTLLRAVGNVLESIDGERSRLHKHVIAARWDEGKPEIFTRFIDATRSDTIKEYRSGALLLADTSVSPMSTYDVSAMSLDNQPTSDHTAMATPDVVLR